MKNARITTRLNALMRRAGSATSRLSFSPRPVTTR